MFTSIRSRLLLSYLVVVVLGMSLASFLAWRAVEGLYLDTQRENLLAQARLSADALQGQSLAPLASQPYSQTTNVMPGIHARFLAEAGGVVVSYPFAGSDLPAPAAEGSAPVSPQALAARPEVAQALRGEPAAAVREVSAGGGRRVLYAAAPVSAADGQVAGLVYLAMPLPQSGLPPGLAGQLGGALLAAVLLAGLAGLLLARRLARPVEAMARAAQAVSAGDLEAQAPAGSRVRELDNLAAAFNAMTASLRQSHQARNAFIADVTHELRTPLTVIQGTIETLQDGALDDPAGRGPLLAAMQHESERLIRLVNDLLVLTRADAGMLQLDRQPLDLAELAGERCQRLGGLAERRGVRLVVEAQVDAGAQVSADPDRLSQVLDNLLDNAIRYSPAGGAVTVTVRRQGGEVSCAVRDEGPGIAPRHLARIFERFYRADPARDRKTGGAGLGLAIAQALVAAHGGRIWAESQEGHGASVSFALPAAPGPELP